MTTWNLFGILKTSFSLQQSYQIVAYDKLSPDILRLLYTIQARGDEDTDKRLAQLPEAQRQTEQQHMLQDLLIDRFQLKFHWEDRVVPGYRLLISKRGSKLLPAGSLPVDAASRSHDGTVRVLHQSRDDLGGTVYMGRGASLADLIPLISTRMRSPVQDATGFGGNYDFDFRPLGRTTEDNPQDTPQDQMAGALQDQLGLRLEAAQIKLRVLVIDHMESPSPN